MLPVSDFSVRPYTWRGFHHHLVLAALAYLFILTIYLASKKVLG